MGLTIGVPATKAPDQDRPERRRRGLGQGIRAVIIKNQDRRVRARDKSCEYY